MPSVFKVDFFSISLQIFWLALAKCMSGTVLCQFVKHVRHNETSFLVLDRLHWCSYTSKQKHQLLVHSKVLCLTVSNPGKMWHGHSLMGSHWHIQDWTQNLLLQSACRSYRSGPPRHHHCLPETLLPKMLVSKISVSLIWMYIHSQLQTNVRCIPGLWLCNTKLCCFHMNFFTN